MTDDDIKRARVLVSDLQRSSLFQTRLAGDTITALLAERDALARDAARWRALLELDSPTVCECEENGDWVPVHPQNIEKVVDAAMKGASDE